MVDGGRLRGLITRANCLRAAHCVLRTQNTDEFNFFSTRIKVKDLMVRNPATVEASDTMEHCLRRGQELGIAQFPVMDGGKVVGVFRSRWSLNEHQFQVLNRIRQSNGSLQPQASMAIDRQPQRRSTSVSYTHLRAHETVLDLVCRLLLEKKKHKLT